MEKRGDWSYEIKNISESTREFDIAYWQAQGPSAIFKAAWELVETAWILKGRNRSELRLQRSDFIIQSISG
jgi:hypothetical protein